MKKFSTVILMVLGFLSVMASPASAKLAVGYCYLGNLTSSLGGWQITDAATAASYNEAYGLTGPSAVGVGAHVLGGHNDGGYYPPCIGVFY